ncbi:MAG TPA: segregation/condensation protein A [Chloroflexota bacterium]|nr:segregation/condensation protein A [Chloroflexota bacterium]
MPIAKTAYGSLSDAHLTVDGFDGSLELLLHHLDEGKLEITAISLASVADQYLATVRLLPHDTHKLDFLAEFLVIGAQLLVIKSRALLPREASRAADDESLDEQALEERLREYRRYREAAGQLGERQERGERAFHRTSPPPLPPKAPPPRLERAAPEHLAAALQRLLAVRLPAPAAPEPPPRVTIGQRIDQVRRALRERGRVSFEWLAEDCQTRGELIVTFLALLELYRKWEIELEQDQLFGEIWIAPGSAVAVTTEVGGEEAETEAAESVEAGI